MEQIYNNLYIGGDVDYDKLKGKEGWSFSRCCKYGNGGHQQVLGYSSLGAPKDKNYLSARPEDNHIAINILDLDDPNMIPIKCVEVALSFIKERLDLGNKVLVSCNKGASRGPSMGLAFLRAVGDMPHSFGLSERIYHTLYPKYDPGLGMRQMLRSNWSYLDNLLNKQEK